MHIDNQAVRSPVPPQPAKLTYPEMDAVYRALYALKREIGLSLTRRERAEVMIGACILRRFDTQELIVKALRSIGLSPNLVLDTLRDRTGDDPWAHLWRCEDSGRYCVNETV